MNKRLLLPVTLFVFAACGRGADSPPASMSDEAPPVPRDSFARESASDSTSNSTGDSAITQVVADTLADRLCQNLSNSYKCAQAIERHLLQRGVHGVTRHGSELTIALARGGSLTLVDSVSDTPAGVWHSYRATLPSIGYHVVELQYYEGGDYLLVNAHSGKTTLSHGIPVVAPDDGRLVAANVDLDAEYSPTILQIWRVDGDSLVLEWEHDFIGQSRITDSTWGPTDPRWLSPTELVVVKQYGFGRNRGHASVRLGPEGWRLIKP